MSLGIGLDTLQYAKAINKTVQEVLHLLNKTREGPVMAPNAPAVPEWLLHALLYAYTGLLALALLLAVHYVYYTRRAANPSPPPSRAAPSHDKLVIIVPVKGESVSTIVESVRRLAALECPNSEVLIVSDDPPEKFEETKKAVGALGLSNVKTLRRPNPAGYKGTALNWAVERASGQVLAFLDVDDLPPPDLCARARSVGENEIAFLGWSGYAPIKTPLAKLLLFLYKYLLYYTAIVGRYSAGHPILALGSGIAIKKEFFKRLGGFCNCTADDYDISIKAYLNGGRVAYLPGTPVYVEVPAGYNAFKRQYARWTYNSAYLLARYAVSILRQLKVSPAHRLSILMNVATHPLMVITAAASVAIGMIFGYLGMLLPPLHILALQLALFVVTMVHILRIYSIARRDGVGLRLVFSNFAKSGALLLTLCPYLTLYTILGLLGRRIKWRVTPKGASALEGGAWGPYEIVLIAALAAILAAAIYVGNFTLMASAAVPLAAVLYTLAFIAAQRVTTS